MTRQHRFKQRVRAVMRQRGINYSTARASLLEGQEANVAAVDDRAGHQAPDDSQDAGSIMREVLVTSVTTDWTEEERERLDAAGLAPGIARVTLQAVGGSGSLKIFMMGPEAASIARVLEGVTLPRPMTHDLYVETLRTMNAAVTGARITGDQDGTFYAELDVESPVGTSRISSRPSDAIAIALRADVPLFAAEDLLD